MITPEQLREWAQDADDGEDVALDGETLREIAELIESLQDQLQEADEEVERLSADLNGAY
ncbi:hypothetical protein SLPG_00046 [Salicola phage CGphi29]|uniref:hypothetical protein n=1 Tax=Salicola phage CGphi29 TaxID=754067 RepID=UPI0002C05A07|nr:hypothetical protein SLPG_00046 [Salicola phage CGphi29]AGH31840.1 hypothetical protein SLPG_00046 [Salicola phage CGphi29]